MSKDNRKVEEITIDVSMNEHADDEPIDIGFNANTETSITDASADEIKTKAGEFAKAAGGLAGSFGKFAVKKGSEIKNKIEDEEIKEKAVKTVKSVSSTAVNSFSQVSRKVSETTESAKRKPNKAALKKEPSGDKRTVSGDTQKTRSGIAASIEKKKERKAEQKAEKERIKAEEKKKSLKMGILLMAAGLVFSIILLIVGGLGGDQQNEHEGQIQPPAEDMYDKSYRVVAENFENAGFTNVSTEPVKDAASSLFTTIDGVSEITINGETYSNDNEDDNDNWFDPDSEVKVYYHAYTDFDYYTHDGHYKEEEDRTVDPEDYKILESFVGKQYVDVEDSIKALGYADYFYTSLLHVEWTRKMNYNKGYILDDIIYVDSYDRVVVYQLRDVNDEEVEPTKNAEEAKVLFGDDVEKTVTDYDKKYDFGYARVRAKVKQRFSGSGTWEFWLLSKDGSESGHDFYYYDYEFEDIEVSDDCKERFEDCLNAPYSEENNYIFTFEGPARYTPAKEGSGGAHSQFHIEADKIVDVEKIN